MTTFEIRIDLPSGKYRMQVERYYAGESIEKFKITGGSRSFEMQSNRPELLQSGARKSIKWQMIQAPPITDGNIESITYAVFMIEQEIEKYLNKTEPNYQSYIQAKQANAN